MGWKTDWLYILIFDHVRYIWKRVKRHNDIWNADTRIIVHPELRQPPMERLLIKQLTDCDLSNLHDPLKFRLTGQELRAWCFVGKDFEPQSGEVPGVVRHEQKVEGNDCLFYKQGIVRFYISPDRKSVIFDYATGLHYAREYVV